MFALLQIYPLEALDDPADGDRGVDVLAVGDSEEQLEQFLADYEQRYHAANQEWKRWDDLDREWNEMHDRKIDELALKYRVSDPATGDVHWEPEQAGVARRGGHWRAS